MKFQVSVFSKFSITVPPPIGGGGAVEIVKLDDVAELRPVAAAISVYVPVAAIDRSEKVATPLRTDFVNVPASVPDDRDSVTWSLLSPVSRLP